VNRSVSPSFLTEKAVAAKDGRPDRRPELIPGDAIRPHPRQLEDRCAFRFGARTQSRRFSTWPSKPFCCRCAWSSASDISSVHGGSSWCTSSVIERGYGCEMPVFGHAAAAVSERPPHDASRKSLPAPPYRSGSAAVAERRAPRAGTSRMLAAPGSARNRRGRIPRADGGPH
jgi:hypothetical protein